MERTQTSLLLYLFVWSRTGFYAKWRSYLISNSSHYWCRQIVFSVLSDKEMPTFTHSGCCLLNPRLFFETWRRHQWRNRRYFCLVILKTLGKIPREFSLLKGLLSFIPFLFGVSNVKTHVNIWCITEFCSTFYSHFVFLIDCHYVICLRAVCVCRLDHSKLETRF